MKPETNKKTTKKMASWMIVASVAVGTLLISGIAEVAPGSSILARIFFFFLGSIIVVQVIPGVLLMGAMLKAVGSLVTKKSLVKAEVPTR